MAPAESENPPAQSPDRSQWLKALRSQVHATTFKNGREYAEGRRVSLSQRTQDRVAGTVLGSTGERYQVELLPKGDDVDSHCSCDQWGKGGKHCKHVVAAALVHAARLRREAINALAAQQANVGAEPAAPAADEEGLMGGGFVPTPDPNEISPTASLPGLAKLESWLGLSSLPDFDFVYRLTPGLAPSGNRHWVVDVRRNDAQAKGPVHVKRTLAQGLRIAPTDERIFIALSRFESRFDARIAISDEDLAGLLELLRTRRVVYRGTALIYSEEPARPQIHLASKDEGAMARLELRLPAAPPRPVGVEGTEEQGPSTISLRDAVVLSGARTWAIVGQMLYSVEPDFPPRLMRKWLLEPTMSFPHNQLDRALTFFAAHLPRFDMSLQAEGIAVDDNAVPSFVLTLDGGVEKTTAKLAARYGNSSAPVSPTAVHLGYASGNGPDGGRMLFRRREVDERAAGKRLTELGFRYDPQNLLFEAAGDTAISFWAEGKDAIPKDWEVFGAVSKVKIRPRVKPRVRVGMSGVNWFELEAEFVTDDMAVDLGAVRMWLDSGRKFIPLKDGSFALADREELKRAADLLEEAGAAPGKTVTRLPLYQAAALDLLSELDESFQIEGKAQQAIRELQGSGGVPVIPAPEGLTATLRHYQEVGLSWLIFLYRHGLSGILADDMGLGKTIQSLSMLQQIKNSADEHKPSLVVAPTSVLPNWEREAEKFTPGLTRVVWHGGDRHENEELLSKSDVVLTSYSLIRRDADILNKVKFRFVLLDEAQNIKNADSATAQACKALDSEARIALTGTPLENRLSELWSIFDFLMPGFLGSASGFHDRYEQPIQVANDIAVRDRLRRRIRPFILRRLKTEVAKDLPPKTETVAYCEMDAGQAALYREVLEESRRKVNESIEKMGFKRSRVSILAALMRLRQVCCDPRLLKLPPGTSLPASAKLERFTGLMEELVGEGHRALVFSQFTEMLELLKQNADEQKVPYLYLDGRTRDRMAKVDAFNDKAGPPLFFISLKAGGTGLNLTAADYVIHYDPWWNPAVEDQATDRTHRIGQTKAVISYKLITRGTVEEKILALQKRKRDLAQGVLSQDSEAMADLSEADVVELFRED